MAEAPVLNGSQPVSPNSTQRPMGHLNKIETYQDEQESRDSKFKAIWDGEMEDLQSTTRIHYRKASALLISWHESIDDLHTGEEVSF
jgi:hypothetical protein